MVTALPLGLRRIAALRTLTTEALAVLMPFKAQEILHQGGVYYGQNTISKNLILANRWELLMPFLSSSRTSTPCPMLPIRLRWKRPPLRLTS